MDVLQKKNPDSDSAWSPNSSVYKSMTFRSISDCTDSKNTSTFMIPLVILWTISHMHSKYPESLTVSLCVCVWLLTVRGIEHCPTPSFRDWWFFCVHNDNRTDYFTPCACMHGNEMIPRQVPTPGKHPWQVKSMISWKFYVVQRRLHEYIYLLLKWPPLCTLSICSHMCNCICA